MGQRLAVLPLNNGDEPAEIGPRQSEILAAAILRADLLALQLDGA